MSNICIFGDCRDSMRELIAQGVKVQMCVTSPPYWGLRDYGVAPSVWGGAPDCDHQFGQEGIANVKQGQFCRCGAWLGCLGLEPDYRMFIAHLVEVFGLVWDLLADDGTLWLNLGDSYASTPPGCANGGVSESSTLHGVRGISGTYRETLRQSVGRKQNTISGGLKPKDLCLMPARVAIALQEAGWWVRQDIIWHKPNPMPESVRDRCTKAHEYIFLLSKRERYYFDADAIAEPVSPSMLQQIEQGYNGHATKDFEGAGVQDASATKSNILRKYKTPDGWDTSTGGGGHGSFHKDGREKGATGYEPKRSGNKERKPASARGVPVDTDGRSVGAVAGSVPWEGYTRNKRSVWTVTTKPFSGAHFATFPPDLIEPCILAGCPPGGIVFDPFGGSGTTAEVAQNLGRNWILCELNPAYGPLQEQRTAQQGLML